MPASSWRFVSLAAGTGFFFVCVCELEAQLLKHKTWLFLNIVCFHQDLDLGQLVWSLTSLRTENPVFL